MDDVAYFGGYIVFFEPIYDFYSRFWYMNHIDYNIEVRKDKWQN